MCLLYHLPHCFVLSMATHRFLCSCTIVYGTPCLPLISLFLNLPLSYSFGYIITLFVELQLLYLWPHCMYGLYLHDSLNNFQTTLRLSVIQQFGFTQLIILLHHVTAHNWQKWKRVFLTSPCHKIYRDEAVGLKSCKYTWKITKFVKMWNLGQFREILIFCQ